VLEHDPRNSTRFACLARPLTWTAWKPAKSRQHSHGCGRQDAQNFQARMDKSATPALEGKGALLSRKWTMMCSNTPPLNPRLSMQQIVCPSSAKPQGYRVADRSMRKGETLRLASSSSSCFPMSSGLIARFTAVSLIPHGHILFHHAHRTFKTA